MENSRLTFSKGCFLIKSANFSDKDEFSTDFLKDFCRACREYRDDTSTGDLIADSDDLGSNVEDEPAILLESPKLILRKKEQREPKSQIFGALSCSDQKWSKVSVLQTRLPSATSETQNEDEQPRSVAYLQDITSSKIQKNSTTIKVS